MKLGDIFERSKQYLFIGQMELTEDELDVIKSEIHKHNFTRNVSRGISQAVSLYVIHLAKQYDTDKLFYDYIESSFDKPDFKFVHIYSHLEAFFNEANRPLFIKNKRLFKTSILAQAMSPKDSMFGLFSLLDDVLNESLLGFYQLGDPIVHSIVMRLSSKISNSDIDDEDDDLNIGGKFYKLRASLRHTIISDPERFEQLIDIILSQLSKNSKLDKNDYLYKLLNQWSIQNVKVVDDEINKQIIKTRIISINDWKPKIQFHENNPYLDMPNLRLDKYEEDEKIQISIKFGEKIHYQTLYTFGNALVMNIASQKFNLLLDNNNENINLNFEVIILQNEQTIFEHKYCTKDLFVYNDNIVDEKLLETLDYVVVYTTYESDFEKEIGIKPLKKFVYYWDLTRLRNDEDIIYEKQHSEDDNRTDIKISLSNIIEDLKYSSAKYQSINVYGQLEYINFTIPDSFDTNQISIYCNLENKYKEYKLLHSEQNSYYIEVEESTTTEIIRVEIHINNLKQIKYLDALINFPDEHPFTKKIIYDDSYQIIFNNSIYILDPMIYAQEFDFLDGKVSYRFNYLTWNYGDYKAMNKSLKVLNWYESSTNSKLTILSLKDPIGYFNLRMMNVVMSYSSSVEIDLIPLFEEFRDKYKDEKSCSLFLEYGNQTYELLSFGFKPHLISGYYFEAINKKLYVDFLEQYCGPIRKFKLDLWKNDQKISWEIDSLFYIDLADLEEGVYQVTISTKPSNIFIDDSMILAKFKWTYGDPYKFRFTNSKLKIDKCSWLENPNRFDVKAVHIQDIEYLDNRFFPQYTAKLYNQNETHSVKVKIVSKDRLEIERIDVSNHHLKSYRYDKKRKTLINKKSDSNRVFDIEEIYYSEVENV